MKRISTIITALALIVLASCKGEYEALLASGDADAKYKAAFKYFEAKKYNKAAQLFESLSVMSSGTERDDTVQYYWALSNYRFKDYYTAETNFTHHIENFPLSPFTEESRFLRIDCLFRSTLRYELDQSRTYSAIGAIEQYMNDYGTHNTRKTECEEMLAELNGRLDRKAYEAARLYYKMEDYKASRVAFRNVLKDKAENIYREDILYYIAMSSYRYASLSVRSKQKERYMTFVDDYLNFIGEVPESAYRRELDIMYKRALKALGRYSGTDAELEAKNREFERTYRKIESEKNKEAREQERQKAKEKKANSKKNETAGEKAE
ncbi:MAG: outer membrane protein assembly factor BamD [Bacteroidales bacterium]|nr:outer membrane protein assembly factor BamD [Bacteroidales bacterium]